MIAESYERIHRSNLVGMGVIPLEYLSGDTADSLGLTGRERYTVIIPEQLTPRMIVDVKVRLHSCRTRVSLHCWGNLTLDVISVCPHSSTLGKHSRCGWDSTLTWSWHISTTEASSTTWSARCPKTKRTAQEEREFFFFFQIVSCSPRWCYCSELTKKTVQ